MSSFSLWSVISSCFEDGGGRFPFGHIRGKNLAEQQEPERHFLHNNPLWSRACL